jgi:phosphoribosyl 1,2-cyclic phosphodiesterase
MYGVRGSFPSTNQAMMQYGLSTTCAKVEVGDDLFIVDAGSGIVGLGTEAIRSDIHLFFTHQHWDHIHGLPFFRPLHNPNVQLTMYGETKVGGEGQSLTLEQVLQGQMTAPYFPVDWRTTRCAKTYHATAPGSVYKFKNAEVEAVRLNHPDLSLGYIIRSDEGNVALLWDHEPADDEKLKQSLQGIDAIVIDGMYTEDEYYGRNGHSSHEGWGHGTNVTCAKLGQELGCGVYITHHDPSHTDTDVRAMIAEAQAFHLRVMAARELVPLVLGK